MSYQNSTNVEETFTC